MTQQSRSSGVLFPRPPEGSKPNMTGSIDLTPELIQEINQLAAQGVVRLRLAAWNKQSKRPGGSDFLSLNVEIDRVQPGQEQRQAPQQSWGGPRQQTSTGYAPRGNQQSAPGRPVQGGHFQTPQRPARQLPPEGGQQGYPFDDEIPFGSDSSSPWRK